MFVCLLATARLALGPAIDVPPPVPSPPPAREPETEPPSGGRDEDDGEAPGAADGASSALPEGLTLPELEVPLTVAYPPRLAELAEAPSGTLVLELTVGSEGTVLDVAVVTGVHPDIDAEVLHTVRSLTYRPATYHGTPIEVTFRMQVPVQAPPPPPAASPEIAAATPPPAPPSPTDPGPVRIFGRLLEGGDRRPVAGAQVLAYAAEGLPPGRISRRQQRAHPPSPEATAAAVVATTDDEGRFEIRGVSDGASRLVFVAPGYERLEHVVELPAGEAVEGKFYLVVAHDQLYRTTVEIERPETADLTRRKLSPEALDVMPGTGGDAIKGITNLPGVARAPFGLGDVLLRGAGPGDSVSYIGQHDVPLPFHFFGVTSVVPTSMLESVDVIPSSYDARYGDAIGGVLDVQFRNGRTDRVHGEAFADVTQAGAMLEVPVGKGWIMAGARRSYVGAVLKAFEPSFTVAPRYWDYQGSFGHPLGPGQLVVRAFGADDRMEGVGDDVDDAFDFQLGFHRVDLEYRGAKGPWSFVIAPGYRRIGQDAKFTAEERTVLVVDSVLWRAEATWAPKPWIQWQFGTQGDVSRYALDLDSTPFDQFGYGEIIHSHRTGKLVNTALYTSATFSSRSGFSVTPGVRGGLVAGEELRWLVDPRLRAKWRLPSKTTIKAGGGTYSQVADPEYWVEDFGNPRLRPERAWHLSGGVEQELPYDISVEATGFVRRSWDLAMRSDAVRIEDGETVPLNAENTGTGWAYGAEFLLERDFSKNLSGWIAYTLMRSELRTRPGESYRPAPWDQTHNLVVMGHWRLPRNWSVGLRFRLTSGNLTTPITDGVLDSRSGNYVPVLGPENSDRLSLFHQLDLRVDKTWTVRAVNIDAYLDVQNVYNAKNPEFIQSGFDFKESVPVRSIPILPSLGLKVSF